MSVIHALSRLAGAPRIVQIDVAHSIAAPKLT